MEATQATQQATQDKLDPRRLGRSSSGLSDQDKADVVCVLHPSSPAAFQIVQDVADRNPQHILQNQDLAIVANNESATVASEADTILMKSMKPAGTQDLALRFSSRVIDPSKGFCFGRNVWKCDINLDPLGTQKRVSNVHFQIFLNHNGVLMLEDVSTNGTVVDGTPLGGRRKEGDHMIQKLPSSRMLAHGVVIEVLSPTQEEIIKFILGLPTRDPVRDEYTLNFHKYMEHVKIARPRTKEIEGRKGLPMPDAHTRAVTAAPLAGPANNKALPKPAPQTLSSAFPMHWDGGAKYNCVGLLGKGAFATVYHIATTYSGDYFAAKELDKKRFMKNNQLDTRLENEMNIMQDLRHPNIVQYVDFVEMSDHLYIIMEFVPGGDLQGYMQSHGTLPEDPARNMTRQILDALKYLHQRNITHRDIKPDNILLCSETPFDVKLTDFGLSKVVKNNETFLKTFCGTLLYCAPEVFPHYEIYLANKRPKRRRQGGQPRRSYSQLVDVWSYAAVLWTALCGKPPFEGVVDAEGKGMFNQIMQTAVDPTPLKDCGVSDHACDLLQLMLDTDPASRPSEAECLRHPWLNGGNWLPDAQGGRGELEAINEDEEALLDIDASQLSIHDERGSSAPQTGSDDAIQAPEAKRARGDDSFAHDRESVPLFSDTAVQGPPVTAAPDLSRPPRLFGEISQRALQSSGALNRHTAQFETGYRESQPDVQGSWNDSSNNSGDADSRILDWGLEMSHTSGDENAAAGAQYPNRKRAGISLSGATSMVRELHMADVPHTPLDSQKRNNDAVQQQSLSTNANDHTPVSQLDAAKPMPNSQSSIDKTPRPRKPFDRQISLPITASSYYDPYNETTHNLEYASRISGHDFALQPQTDTKGVVSLPETVQASFRSGEESDVVSATTSAGGVETDLDTKTRAQASPDEQAVAGTKQGHDGFIKPPPRFGRLTSTPDSFVSISLPITSRQTTWGRLPGTTITYPHPTDTRIPKQALELLFDAPGIIQAESEGGDWTKLNGLRLLILTRSRAGIWINGVKLLEKDDKGQRFYGRLTDGDVIEVFRPPRHGQGQEQPLKFIVELALETARWQRSPGKAFEVLKHREGSIM